MTDESAFDGETAAPTICGEKERGPLETCETSHPTGRPARGESRPAAFEVVPKTATTLRAITSRQCHYPIGEPKGLDTVYCGAAKRPGSSYCWHHHHVVWTPVPPSTNTSKAWRA